jgi:adenylylsulfate kinase-like enzyme
VIVWLNGTFGVGKSATAAELARIMPGSRVFDAEIVGYMLMTILQDQTFSDFQDLPPWRTLVPVVTAEIERHTGQDLLAVQTVLSQAYWAELTGGFREQKLDVFHVLLEADPQVLAQRIEADEAERTARQWRLDHIGGYLAARGWLTAAADLVVDSTTRTPEQVAQVIVTAAAARPAAGQQALPVRGTTPDLEG